MRQPRLNGRQYQIPPSILMSFVNLNFSRCRIADEDQRPPAGRDIFFRDL